jgi:predicted ATPase
MGELLARAAAAGIQVLLETHSDHVLNGIRIAVYRGHVPHAAVALYHTAWQPGTKSPILTPLQIGADGRLNAWPEGFFDEIDKSLDQLLSQ